jgi:D-hexose-6-phosphate mutarotase
MSHLEICTITHKALGASIPIHPFGATLLSFTNGAGQSILFVSQQSKLDGSAPVQGGTPLVFPIFENHHPPTVQ